jgi:hypothetical protein
LARVVPPSECSCRGSIIDSIKGSTTGLKTRVNRRESENDKDYPSSEGHVSIWFSLGVRLIEEATANRHKFTDPANRLSLACDYFHRFTVLRSFDSLVNNLHSKS